MGGEWRELSLGDSCSKIGSGATPRGGKEAYLGGETALIRSQNIYNDRFVRDGLVFIDDKQAEELKNVVVEEGDVMLNITGDSVARCCQVASDVLPARVNQHVAIIRPRSDVLDATFLRYSLVSPSTQAHLLALASAGATRNALTKAMIQSLPIIAPSVPEQRAIAHILGTLDDKIELNRRRNQTLDAMARALFKDWFVDFGPVRAKMNLPSPPGRGAGGEGAPRQPRSKLPLPENLLEHARQLRGQATDAENLLWRLLRGQQLAGAKFRRQHAMPPYILDFYCHEAKLAVELDGGQHNQAPALQHDARRTAYLEARGIKVLRFWNNDVLRQTEAVLEAIYQALAARREGLPSPPAPLPGGEGSQKPFSPRGKGWDEGAYLPPDLWELFPDRLDDEGKPEGWEMGTLSDIAEHPRRSIQPEKIEPDTAYIALEHMPKRCIALSEWGSANTLESNKYEFNKGEILFGKLRPYFHKIGVAPVDGVCSTDIVVITAKEEKWFSYTLCHVSSDEFVEHTNAGSTGTKMPRTNWNDMARYEIVIPSTAAVEAFNAITKPWIEQIIEGIHESRTLAQLRDTLLPKLISGELRIADAEKFIEAAQ